ncbi:hypothetical protein [Haliangium sp.]|uniref:hypothetical protein n=1 Tax=Haliangium sp. TaxID=2663208 RepID=UPI003D118D65
MTIDSFVRLPDTISYAELADEVRSALLRSRVIPDINLRETELPPSPVLAAAGVKSFTTFHRGARLVAVSTDGVVIKLIPTANDGPRCGFAHLEPITVPETATPDELGEAIERAIALCK